MIPPVLCTLLSDKSPGGRQRFRSLGTANEELPVLLLFLSVDQNQIVASSYTKAVVDNSPDAVREYQSHGKSSRPNLLGARCMAISTGSYFWHRLRLGQQRGLTEQ